MSAQPTTTSTPTTRILAIGTINPGVDQAKVLGKPRYDLAHVVSL